MRMKNMNALQNLSMFCHLSGIVSIILGFLVIGIDVINKDYGNIQVGIFIIAIGYTFVKIAAKLNAILTDEKRYAAHTSSGPGGTPGQGDFLQ